MVRGPWTTEHENAEPTGRNPDTPVYARIVWLAIGAVAGWLAQRIIGKVGPFGLLGDITIGTVEATIGGYHLGLLGASGIGGILGSFPTALVRAVLLVWVLRKVIEK